MTEPKPSTERARTLQRDDLPTLVTRTLDLCEERNAREILVLDLRGLSYATDYFVIASGDSDTHVKAISEHLIQRLKQTDSAPAGVEGLGAGRWVLIDYIDFVVHVFHPVLRDFYQLENLWGDAPALSIEAPEA